ncbi:MAG: hypothetical protein JXB07_13465 [Anaerolineae bacterium]|nr:hypothetical protein [Anaerolineae bacterium]
MSYRHDGKKAHQWHRWLHTHRDEIIRCGIPDCVLVDELYWIRFLEEAGYDYATGWSTRLLTPDQAQALRAFLTREYGNSYLSLLYLLDQTSNQDEGD